MFGLWGFLCAELEELCNEDGDGEDLSYLDAVNAPAVPQSEPGAAVAAAAGVSCAADEQPIQLCMLYVMYVCTSICVRERERRGERGRGPSQTLGMFGTQVSRIAKCVAGQHVTRLARQALKGLAHDQYTRRSFPFRK